MVDLYSFDKISILLGYLNKNSLYEWEMFQKLLIHELKNWWFYTFKYRWNGEEKKRKTYARNWYRVMQRAVQEA